MLVAIASLAALAIVASIDDADALSTVALALAILAFVVQIMIFIAQAWSGGQQLSQSHELNAGTMAALSELRTRASGTEQILARQVDTAMRFAFERSQVELRKRDLPPDQAAEELEDALPDELPVARPEVSNTDRRILERLFSFPTPEEAEDLLPHFVNLSPLAGSSLRFMAQDERDSRLTGVDPGVGAKSWDSPGVVELRREGLIERASDAEDEDDEPWVRLTPRGREVARFVLAPGPLPDYLRDAFAPSSD